MSDQPPGIRIACLFVLLSISLHTLSAQPTRRLQRAADENTPVKTATPETASTDTARWALVIGNADYATGRLNNPVNDARDMADLLEQLGFDVDLRQNTGHQAMEDAIRTFGYRLQAGGVGLFYFAGHGVQLDGKNFLIPVGSRIASATEIPYKSVDLRYVLDHMGEDESRLNIVILDACRDNPFFTEKTRGASSALQGLAQFEAPTGTIISYATAPGKVAGDGTGSNGLFTQHLLEAFAENGLSIEQVFKKTRKAVAAATDRRQVPWTSSSLLGEFVPRPQPPPIAVAEVEPRIEVPIQAETPPSETPPSETQPAETPPSNNFSLEPLRREESALNNVRHEWDQHQREMEDAFQEVDRYEERTVPPYLKADAWHHFLEEFEQDNPFTISDNTLRSQALTRREQWDREANRIRNSSNVPEPILTRPGYSAPAHGNLNRPAPGPADLDSAEWNPIEQNFVRPAAGTSRYEELIAKSFRYVPTTQYGSPTDGFWMAETELTQGLWHQLLGSRPSYFDGCADCPVENVNWYEALTLTNILSESQGLETCYELTGCRGTLGGGCPTDRDWCFGDFICQDVWYKGSNCQGYRLPTEREWEHAARAGTSTAFSTGDSLSLDEANIHENQFQRLDMNRTGTIEVARFQANDWGLFDIHGNVLEWTWDGMGEHRVVRGGSWKDPAELCRSGTRRSIHPGRRFSDVGFRLVRSAR